MTRSPSRDDTGTMTCPVCQSRFTPAGRQRYCSSVCRKTAWRRRQDQPLTPVIPAARPRRDHTIYECPECGQRLAGEQRCPDCGDYSPGGSASAGPARTAASPSRSPTYSKEVTP
jgi:hypothetical protein